MSIWKDLGVTADVVAAADQLEAEARESLENMINEFAESFENHGERCPPTLIFKSMMDQIVSDESGESFGWAILMFAVACDKLVQQKMGATP